MSFEHFISIISKISFSCSICFFNDLHVGSQEAELKALFLLHLKEAGSTLIIFWKEMSLWTFCLSPKGDNTARLVFARNLSILYLKRQNNWVTFSIASYISKVKRALSSEKQSGFLLSLTCSGQLGQWTRSELHHSHRMLSLEWMLRSETKDANWLLLPNLEEPGGRVGLYMWGKWQQSLGDERSMANKTVLELSILVPMKDIWLRKNKYYGF